MTWKFCSVFGCDNSEKKKIACVQGCKKSHSKEKCTHERKYPELQNVTFFPFPKDAELRRKWFIFLRRNDIRSVKHITSNHMICSIHFQGGVGFCKADPVPTIHNDPVMAVRFNESKTKRKAPRSRSPSVQVKRKCYKPVSKVTSTTTRSERDEASHLKLLPVRNGHEDSKGEFLVHDLHSAVKHDHNYSSVNCSVGTQTFLSSKDLDEQNEEIKRLKAKLEDKANLRRELFVNQATMNDSAVRFYTGIPSLALLLAIFNILKPAAEKMKYWVKGESTQAGKYMVRLLELHLIGFLEQIIFKCLFNVACSTLPSAYAFSGLALSLFITHQLV